MENFGFMVFAPCSYSTKKNLGLLHLDTKYELRLFAKNLAYIFENDQFSYKGLRLF